MPLLHLNIIPNLLKRIIYSLAKIITFLNFVLNTIWLFELVAIKVTSTQRKLRKV